MKGGSRSVSRRMVVAFFVLLYRTQPNNTVFWNQKTIPKLFRPPLFNTGHLRFYLPGICPRCPGNGVRSFVNRKSLKWGCFSSLLEPPPLFMKATVLLDTGSDGFVCMFSRCRKSSEKPRKSDDFLIFIKNFVIIYM